MIKAVFIDYMGTVVDGHTPEMGEIIQRICKHSHVRDPKQIQCFILTTSYQHEADSYLK